MKCCFLRHRLICGDLLRRNDTIIIYIFNLEDNCVTLTLSNELVGLLVGLTINIDVNFIVGISETRHISRDVLLRCHLTQVPSINHRVELRSNDIREHRKTCFRCINSDEIGIDAIRIFRCLTETTVVGVEITFLESILVVINKLTSRICGQRRTINTSRIGVSIDIIYNVCFQFVRRTHSSDTTASISRIDVTVRSIDRTSIKRPTNNWRVGDRSTSFSSFFFELISFWVEDYVITNHIAKFFGVRYVSILTTILVIETSKDVTTSNVILGIQIIF